MRMSRGFLSRINGQYDACFFEGENEVSLYWSKDSRAQLWPSSIVKLVS